MTPLAIVRPSDWETPLFLHVLGAMLLVGGLVVVALSLLIAWRREGQDAVALSTLAYRALFLVVLPAFVVMRVGAQWVASETGYEDADWVLVGYVASDLGAVLLLVALVVAAIALRRRGERTAQLARVVAVLSVLLLAAYVVAIWAMTTKP